MEDRPEDGRTVAGGCVSSVPGNPTNAACRDALAELERDVYGDVRRCHKCDGLMHHERLRGWVCRLGCSREAA